MQSTDTCTVDSAQLNDSSNNDDNLKEKETLPELRNDVVVGEAADSAASLRESDAAVVDPVDGVEGEGLEGEEGDEDMEVDFVENVGSGAVSEGNSLEGGKGNGGEVSGLKAVSECSNVGETIVEGVDTQVSEGKASFNSFAQQLFLQSGNNDSISTQVKVVGIDDTLGAGGNVVEGNETSSVVESQEKQAVGSKTDDVVGDKEDIGANVTGRGDFKSKGEVEVLVVGSGSGAKGSKKATGVTAVSEGRGSVPKSKKKGRFCTSDLVWGKVRSHPWWPAQIFEAGDASELAKKHFKSKSYLVAYFGDQSFAWNEEAKLKPFAPNFSQMAKQSTAEAFQDAVRCAVEEAARRVEFGLSCHCIAEDVYNRIKTQVIENAGIREMSSIREGGDRLDIASSFEPVKFLDHVKRLAQVPRVEDNGLLEQAVAQAQMSAFYRWKGCYHLAEFGPLLGYVNNEADAPVSREKEETQQMIGDATVNPQEEMEEDDVRPHKRKNLSGDNGNISKKMKRVSDPMLRKGKKDLSKQEDREESAGKAGRESISSSVRERKKAKLSFSESKSKESSPQITPLRESKPGLRVGESILRAALQLSQASPLLKTDVSSHGKSTKGNGKSKQSRGQSEAIPFKKSSSDAILSKFLLAAVDPLSKHSSLTSMISFFSDFRDSVVVNIEFLVKHGDSVSYDIVCKSKERHESEPEEMAEGGSKINGSVGDITTTPDIKRSEDASCAGKITKVPELQTSLSDEEMAPAEHELVKSDGFFTALLEKDSLLSGSQPQSVSENVASDSGQSNEDSLQGETTTALTLKFTDMDSIPTEEKLNTIFSAFGPLKESETEVLAKKNCARVVFKRRSDAETAFSSSGKFETFGASLVCYQLNYAPSPRKASSSESKKRRKDGTFAEGIAA